MAGATSCAHPGLKIKVYYSDPDQGGLVRKQANEVIPYAATKGYFALNPSDAEALLNYCFNPHDNPSIAQGITAYLNSKAASTAGGENTVQK